MCKTDNVHFRLYGDDTQIGHVNMMKLQGTDQTTTVLSYFKTTPITT